MSAPGSGGSTGLQGVSCSSRSSCWAVGDFANHAGVVLDQALRWQGAKWSRVAVPQPASSHPNALLDVTCVSRRDCWAVGDLGQHSTQGSLEQIQRWNGDNWLLTKSPNPGGRTADERDYLSGISCTSPSDCWAVGASQPSYGQPNVNEAVHWNGNKWSTG